MDDISENELSHGSPASAPYSLPDNSMFMQHGFATKFAKKTLVEEEDSGEDVRSQDGDDNEDFGQTASSLPLGGIVRQMAAEPTKLGVIPSSQPSRQPADVPGKQSPTRQRGTRRAKAGRKNGKVHFRRPNNHRRPARPGVQALRDIRRYQRSTDLLLPKRRFAGVVRETLAEVRNGVSDLCIQASALAALQEATETFLVSLFSSTQTCAFHAKRITIQPEDMKLVVRICKEWGMLSFQNIQY